MVKQDNIEKIKALTIVLPLTIPNLICINIKLYSILYVDYISVEKARTIIILL